jgi:hypothetical protein
VLNKGESTDNGVIGVKIIDIIPPDRCASQGTYDAFPKAVIMFFRPQDQQVLCKVTIVGDATNSNINCDSNIGVSVIGVEAINTKEGWIYFDLRE